MNDMQARLADLKQKSEDLAENLATASATVTSNDGAVKVTIAPTGALQNLELTQRAAGMNPGKLTASIMEAVRKGQQAASAKMMEAFAPMGTGTESMDLVRSYLPPEEDDEDEFEERDLEAVDALDDPPPPPPPPAAQQHPQQQFYPPQHQQPYPPRPPMPPQPPAHQPFPPPPAQPPPPPARPNRGQPDFEEDENHPW
ncbi:YbaB/EbfC family nucleoid-associated protein [Umezawaea endophytica]|uniref:YbaB/EbfC family nucleoid-associated protein n=1 Tax=Umezawaea endophytica TaxID=1654476 RepID=A0A9X3A2G4_9PSEU|nr:YbaB/EbfC family nucleoid-associated protein [Umezawaea endophytica]MCS7479053.1 YbaB/EbfC family nucleoid-associated protein [Umezawaea endophytica]